MEMKVGPIFKRNKQAYSNSSIRFIVNQGGSRSGKTYSILQLLIVLASTTNLSISVVSISFPHLRRGAIRDFRIMMDQAGLYDPSKHTVTDQTYRFKSGGYIEFFSADQSAKVRGPGRDILFLNEANLFNQDTFEQLNIRTRHKVFMDYNPADEFHWIYERVIPNADAKFLQSTYKDNPFLPPEQIRQIETLRDVDPNFWRVYGLGERGASQHTIFPKFDLYDTIDPYYEYHFGLDFGFNHPTALSKVTYNDGSLYFKQELYESHLTSPELIDRIRPIIGSKYVYCDSSRPEIIQDLVNAGINAYGTKKYDGSVKDSIDYLRSNRIFVHKESIDLQKEMRGYKWKTKPTGEILDEPVKAFDDLIDACRYGAIEFKSSYTPTFSVYQ
jgi:phage terminase large subunit